MNDGRVSIPLDYPFDHDGRRYDCLVMRRPTVEDVIASEDGGSPGKNERILVARCCGVPTEVIGKVDVLGDYEPKLQKVLLGFRRGRSRAGSSGGSSSSSPDSAAGVSTKSAD